MQVRYPGDWQHRRCPTRSCGTYRVKPDPQWRGLWWVSRMDGSFSWREGTPAPTCPVCGEMLAEEVRMQEKRAG